VQFAGISNLTLYLGKNTVLGCHSAISLPHLGLLCCGTCCSLESVISHQLLVKTLFWTVFGLFQDCCAAHGSLQFAGSSDFTLFLGKHTVLGCLLFPHLALFIVLMVACNLLESVIPHYFLARKNTVLDRLPHLALLCLWEPAYFWNSDFTLFIRKNIVFDFCAHGSLQFPGISDYALFIGKNTVLD